MIEKLYEITYQFGVFVFDLFGLSSPEAIMKDAPIKGEFKLVLNRYIPPETFLKKNASFTSHDLSYMDYVVIRHEDSPTMVSESLDNKISKYELYIAVDIFINDFSLKKAIAKIKAAVTKFNKMEKVPYRCDPYADIVVIFGISPSSESFDLDSCLKDAKNIMRSIWTFSSSLIDQNAELQNESLKNFELAENVKYLQNTDRSRLIGLYIWDQVNMRNKSVNEVIREFINTEFFETIMRLNGNDKRDREVQAGKHNIKGRLGQQSEYNEVYRSYEHAKCCIEADAVLSGNVCEKIMSEK